jgi:type II secretory pathway component GspD/PulD (secretin)
LAVTINLNKELGAQIRSREPGTEGLLGTTAKYQTSGLFGSSGIVENPNGTGVNRLLGNLLNLVAGSAGNSVAPGNTIISLGDSLSVWAIIQALETASNVQVLANPFLIATNKTEATVSIGEIRRVITGTIIATSDTNTFGDAPAKLEVKITPQINSDGMIVLDIVVSLSQFVGTANVNDAVRTVRDIKTKTIVANKEVIALGGLINNNVEDRITKVPILGDIPILGWLFKNKSKSDSKSNLLILISSRIIEPEAHDAVTAFTHDHITDYTDTLNEMYYQTDKRDPINRWFFGQKNLNDPATDEFLFRRQKEALDEAKLHKDTVLPTPMAQTSQDPAQQKTVVAARRKKSLVEALSSDAEVAA